MSLQETLEYRRSVRYFDEAKEIDTDKVRRCIELAALAPNSSNMQLWEFYHITDPEMLKKYLMLAGSKQLKLLNKSWSS